MVSLGTIIQRGALTTQGVAPASLTGWLLRRAGVTLRPFRGVSAEDDVRAACCVSLDFDVTKGSRSSPNHEGTHLLLYNAERYEVPLTWAICGMTAEKDPEPFESILKSGELAEIASHTYSHLRADRVTPDELQADHEKWVSVVGDSHPKTFVFPYNKVGNFETLKKLGFSVYRGEERRVAAPILENGLCNVAPVMFLSGRTDGVLGTAKGFIDLCIRYRAVFHLWSHPWNLSREGDPRSYSERVLGPIFAYLKQKAGEGSLDLCTMGQLTGGYRPRTRAN